MIKENARTIIARVAREHGWDVENAPAMTDHISKGELYIRIQYSHADGRIRRVRVGKLAGYNMSGSMKRERVLKLLATWEDTPVTSHVLTRIDKLDAAAEAVEMEAAYGPRETWDDSHLHEPCPCCAADMKGSDHCPVCGCEAYERYCKIGWRARLQEAERGLAGDPKTRLQSIATLRKIIREME